MRVCLVFARFLSIAFQRLALRQGDFCFALSLSNRSVRYSADTLIGRHDLRIRPVFSCLGLDLLLFLVCLGVRLGRIALGFCDIRLNLIGRFGLVARRQAQ